MAANPTPPLQGPEPTRAENIVSTLSEKLATSADARRVYGEPIKAHNRTLVPVAKVGYGLGATSGGRKGEQVGGGGAGGGVGAKPVGYIEISDERTRYVSFSTPRRIMAVLLAGIAAGFFLGRFSR